MSFFFSYLLPPLIGGTIGYITNDIAIRMLFRPHKAKFLFGKQIPFTPGIIPKEKGRIATSIAGAISENLMSKDVLQKNLLSEEMISKIRVSIDSFFEKQKSNPETVREFLAHYLSDEEVDKIINDTRENLSKQLADKLSNSNLGEQISDVVIEHVSSKLRMDGLDVEIPQMLKSLIGGTIWGKIAGLIEKPAKKFLTKNINQMLSTNGQEIVQNLVDKEFNNLASTPMEKLLHGKDNQIAQFSNMLINTYQSVITDYLPRILDTVNIPSIIESRINEMDMDETEKLIFQVMDKELKAIVWLGALLGMIMGCVNLIL